MFSEKERQRRLDAAVQLMKDEDLAAIYLIGNGTVGPNAFGCFRYFTDNRVFFHLSSAVITPDGELMGVVNNMMGKLNLIRSSFVRDALIIDDQVEGVVQILKSKGIEKGRLGIFEIFEVSDDVRGLINSNLTSAQLRKRARELGMRTLREDGIRKVLAGLTSADEIIRVTTGDAS